MVIGCRRVWLRINYLADLAVASLYCKEKGTKYLRVPEFSSLPLYYLVD